MDQIAIKAMLRRPTGPVGRKVIEKGAAIADRAQQMAPGTMPKYIHSVPIPSLLGTSVSVYCDHPATIFVLKGTKPHVIRSRGTWPLQNKAKGLVFGPIVHHPGTKANDFLGKAMREAGPL